jgi:hypothetical protein
MFLGARKRLYNSLHWLIRPSVRILLLPQKSRAWFVLQLVLPFLSSLQISFSFGHFQLSGVVRKWAIPDALSK